MASTAAGGCKGPQGQHESAGAPMSRAAVVRELDRRMMEEIGVPSAVLMEHAGHLCADAIRARFPEARRVRILCGPGNNGGDGYVIARHLHVAGLTVGVEPIAPSRTPEAQAHARVAERLGIVRPLDAPDLVIDALLGTGQRAPVTMDVAVRARAAEAPLVAIDVPTGVDADTGERVGDFPAPAFAVCIGRLKPWIARHPVPWAFADIGLERVATEPGEATWIDVDGPAATTPWALDANKWTRGHVGIVAGSAELAGAAVLACSGALRGGAGLVTLFVPRDAWPRLGQLPPEVMVRDRAALDGDTRVDVFVVGPGLGRAEDARVRRMWTDEPRPCVFDADALRALALAVPSPHPRVLTPHAGEAGALIGEPWQAIEADRLDAAARLRAIAPSILKGACPVVTGAPLRVLRGFLPQLGTGGSGDVLAGLVGAELARGWLSRGADDGARDVAEAAALRAVARQLRAARIAGPPGVTAREIADALVGT
jgi:hydroxyethylthiazole kinase-like uncharacterized protein yjeF